MENIEKLTTSKQVVAYLVEQFPLCFTLVGEAKPLKIGIFQDLTARLADDAKVSKTQLRAALRLYTSSWRYLQGVKENVSRIDLDGTENGTVDVEHVEHAKAALIESKARVAERRKLHAVEKSADSVAENALKHNKSTFKARKSRPSTQKNTKLSNKSVPKAVELKFEEIVVGKNIHVNMGIRNMPATVVEIHKDDVRVRLTNGLTMVIKAEHLCP